MSVVTVLAIETPVGIELHFFACSLIEYPRLLLKEIQVCAKNKIKVVPSRT